MKNDNFKNALIVFGLAFLIAVVAGLLLAEGADTFNYDIVFETFIGTLAVNIGLLIFFRDRNPLKHIFMVVTIALIAATIAGIIWAISPNSITKETPVYAYLLTLVLGALILFFVKRKKITA